jgi:energy-coupling factor transporter transmembrane protein EcfT
MRGENVTISNIERTFRQEYQHVKKNIDRLDPQSIWTNIRDFINEVFILLGKALKVVWSILRFAFGLILIIVSLAFVAAMVGAIYFNFNGFISGELAGENVGSLRDFLNYIIAPESADTLLILAIIIVSLFIAALIYAGLKLMIRFKAKDRWVILSLAIGWIIAVVTFIVLLFGEVNNFKIHRETTEIVNLAQPHGTVLYVDAPSPFGNDNDKIRRLSHQLFDIKTIGNSKEMYGITRIDIEKSNSSVPGLKIIREANGITHDDALDAAKQIIINYKQNDSVLNIDPVFHIKNDPHWKGYFVKIILSLPIGTKVYLNENTKYLLRDIENSDGYWSEDMAGKTWQMTNDGLSKVEDKNKQQN